MRSHVSQTATPRAGIYARQSLGKRKSISEQDAMCTADAQALGWQVADHYEDKVSASRYTRAARPGWDRLVGDLQDGRLDVVVVWEASHGGRKLTTWSAFLDLAAATRTLIRVTDAERTLDPTDAGDWEWLAREGVNAPRVESEKLFKRRVRGQMGQAQSGRPHGRVPYGYERRYEVVDGKAKLVAQEPHPDQAPVVREIVEQVAAGVPPSQIAASLNERGIPAPAGGPWRRGRIRDYVSPLYLGQRVHKGRVYDTRWWPALVDAQTYADAKAVIDGRRRAEARGGRLEFWLSGVATCAVCGGPLVGLSGSGWRAPGYRCAAQHLTVPADALEERVLAYLLGRLARKDVYGRLRRAGEGADRAAVAARDHVATLELALADWRRSATDGRGTTPESLAVIEADLAAQIAAARRAAERAGGSPAVRALVDADNMPARWAAMPVAARRDVARELVTVVVSRASRGRWTPVAERVGISWKGAA
jgi:DNA invertase Pin-like site-specific DNA recombinase